MHRRLSEPCYDGNSVVQPAARTHNPSYSRRLRPNFTASFLVKLAGREALATDDIAALADNVPVESRIPAVTMRFKSSAFPSLRNIVVLESEQSPFQILLEYKKFIARGPSVEYTPQRGQCR